MAWSDSQRPHFPAQNDPSLSSHANFSKGWSPSVDRYLKILCGERGAWNCSLFLEHEQLSNPQILLVLFLTQTSHAHVLCPQGPSAPPLTLAQGLLLALSCPSVLHHSRWTVAHFPGRMRNFKVGLVSPQPRQWASHGAWNPWVLNK